MLPKLKLYDLEGETYLDDVFKGYLVQILMKSPYAQGFELNI